MALDTWLLGMVSTLGVTYADWIFVGVLLATLLFIADEFRYGIFIMFIAQGFLIVLFLNWGLPIIKVLYMLFVLLIVMTFTIIKSRSANASGGF